MEIRKRRASVLAVSVMAAVVGCSNEQVAEPERSTPPAAKVMRFDLAAADYSTDIEVPGRPSATVKTTTPSLELELYALQRSDNVVSIVFALHNTSGKELDLEGPGKELFTGSSTASTYYADDVAIVDGKGLKEYRAYDADGQCLCTAAYVTIDREELGPGERNYHVTQVAAPPASVTKVTVRAGSLAAVSGATITG